ncbi:MAG: Xaa-Pro peptidase family protein [Dehalococcoidia bacterium]|nr:Xaa-Pro peptidase family protein [Dehalococcoidia bacterium]
MDNLLNGVNMNKLAYSTFPKSEYESRYRKLKDLMQKKGIDVMILTDQLNVTYFTGYPAIRPGEGAAILPMEGEPTIVHSVTETGNVERTAWFDDHRMYMTETCPWAGASVSTDSIPVIKNRLGELGGRKLKIGVEAGYEGFKQKLSEYNFLEAQELIWNLRKIKSKAEIELLRKNCEATCKAEMKSFAELKQGMTEREFLKIVLHNFVNDGFGFPPAFALTRTGPLNCRMINSTGSSKPIQRGEIVLLDGGISFYEYPSDVLRMGIIGEPDTRQKRYVDIEFKAQQAAINIIKPGIKAKEIFRAGERVFEAAGLNRGSYLEYAGHGIGLGGYNPPILSSVNEMTIEEGMVLCVEPQCWDAPYLDNPQIDVVVEDTVVVTKKGFEFLTDPKTRDLYVIK